MPSLPENGWQTKTVLGFGGGLDYTKHPAALADDQWADCDGFIARQGWAEVAPPFKTSLATVGVAGDRIIGMMQNPFTNDGAVLAVCSSVGTSKLFTVSGAGTVTQITPATTTVGARRGALATSAFLNGTMYVTFGYNGAATTSLIAWTGGATYAVVTGGLAQLQLDTVAAFKGHVVGGAANIGGGGTLTAQLLRTVGWSDVNLGTSWIPATNSSADSVFLDDVDDDVIMLAPLSSDVLGLFTHGSLHAITATGGIPAFVRSQIRRGIGCVELSTSFGSVDRQSLWGITPLGVVFYAGDDLYLAESGTGIAPISSRIIEWWHDKIRPPQTLSSTALAKPILWHREKKLLIAPRPVLTSADFQLAYYDPTSGAWSRGRVVTNGGTPLQISGQAFIRSVNGGEYQRTHWLHGDRDVYVEDTDFATPRFVASVDTKDFIFGGPDHTFEVDRIKVEWESIDDQGGDSAQTLRVGASMRNSLVDNFVAGNRAGIPPVTFSLVGTITQQQELPVRLRGKILRLSFQTPTGATVGTRIRGFSFRYRMCGTRKTP
jgi:hypothetical protein